MIRDVIVFKNGNVAVCDENGEQLPEYQKLLSNKVIRWHFE